MHTKRERQIAIADSYLQSGIVAHDPGPIPLDARCVRVESGWDRGRTGAEISRQLRRMVPIIGIRNCRWLVEGEQVVARFDLAVADGRLVFITERFRISGGRIREIQAAFDQAGGVTHPVPAAPQGKLTKAARGLSGSPSVELGRNFLRAMTGGEAPPLGPDISVTVNGKLVAATVAAVHEWLESQSRRIGGLWGERWMSEGAEAVAMYQLDLQDGTCLWVGHSFRSYRGLLREVHLNHGVGAPHL